jgi:hypothetical protein
MSVQGKDHSNQRNANTEFQFYSYYNERSRSDGDEDPAYEIIRHAIKEGIMRPLDPFTCEAYQNINQDKKTSRQIMGKKMADEARSMVLIQAGDHLSVRSHLQRAKNR